jgi:hypothetical protein
MWIEIVLYGIIADNGEYKRFWVYAFPTAGSSFMKPMNKILPCN